jgi:DNA repair protein RadA/Sms
VVVPVVEGTRPFLVEVQGLVSRSSFGVVRQKTQGFDANRLALLAAVLEKRMGLNLQDKDIFLNVVGGFRIMDPAADLAVAMAVTSSLLDRVVPFHTAVLGEVGLSSEVRSVSHVTLRVKEAQKLGFRKCILPRNNYQSALEVRDQGMDLVPVSGLKEALDVLKG